jgi:hypothetical protein
MNKTLTRIKAALADIHHADKLLFDFGTGAKR